jgi:uncharacterized protein YkwD
VWPHAWTLSGTALKAPDVAVRLGRFLASFSDSPEGGPENGAERRCGVARARGSDGTEAVAVVVVDALADLDPMPNAARSGQWLPFSAHLLVPASGAKLVVLGPIGPPRAVPTTLHDGHVEATFSVDRRGPWTAQLVATVATGPRPVLEAEIFVDSAPPAAFAEWPAPGEEAGSDAAEPSGLVTMINAARREEELPRLRSSRAMDGVAAQHAARMRDRHLLAHDAGDGGPIERLRLSGLEPRSTGENVAHALGLRRGHRALWMSPSHRGNILDARFDTVGVGVAQDSDGSVWICEIFGDFANNGMTAPADGAY